MSKKIEINSPEGYVAKEEKTENGINIIFVKEDKEKEMKEFLREKLNGTTIKLDDEYPRSVYYLKNDKVLFELEQDGENRYFYVRYDEIWSVFETKYDMEYNDIQSFIKNGVETDLKLGSITTLFKYINTNGLVETDLKLGSITTAINNGCIAAVVETDLKLGSITTKFDRGTNSTKVETDLKLGSITTAMTFQRLIPEV